MKEVLALPYPDYKVLERWTQEELNNPSKTDYYIMQLSQILHAVNSKSSLKVEDFKLRFGSNKPKPMTQEQKNRAIALSQARWKAMVGLKEPPKTEMRTSIDAR